MSSIHTDLIQMPRLSGVEAASLIAEMLTIAARHKNMPAPIERSKKRLEVAQHDLIGALHKGGASADARRASRALDLAWGTTFQWLSGWCKLESAGDLCGRARALFTTLFGEMAAFSRQPHRIDWSEAKARIDAMDHEGHAPIFAALGGEPFLAELRRTLSVPPEVATSVEAREELGVTVSALRQYVTRVYSYVDPDVPGSEELADALLKPLQRFHLTHPWRAPEQNYVPVEETQC